MKNTKRILAFVIAIVMAAGTFAGISAGTKDKWYTPAINYIEENGIDTIGSLAENEISRETFVTWIAKIESHQLIDAAWNDEIASVTFSDVGPTNRRAAIAYAAERGFIVGNGDNTFSPSKTITWGEACAVIVRLMGYEDRVTDKTNLYNYMQVANTYCHAMSATFLREVKLYNFEYKLSYGQAAYLIATIMNCEKLDNYKSGIYSETSDRESLGDWFENSTEGYSAYEMVVYDLPIAEEIPAFPAAYDYVRYTGQFATYTADLYKYNYTTGEWYNFRKINTTSADEVTYTPAVNNADCNDMKQATWNQWYKVLNAVPTKVLLSTWDGTHTEEVDAFKFKSLVASALDFDIDAKFNVRDYVDKGTVLKVKISRSDSSIYSVSLTNRVLVDTYLMATSYGYSVNNARYLNWAVAKCESGYTATSYAPTLSPLYTADLATSWTNVVKNSSGVVTAAKLNFKGTAYNVVTEYTGADDEIKIYLAKTDAASGVFYRSDYEVLVSTGLVFDETGKLVEGITLDPITPADAMKYLINAAQGECAVEFCDADSDGYFETAVIKETSPFLISDRLNSRGENGSEIVGVKNSFGETVVASTIAAETVLTAAQHAQLAAADKLGFAAVTYTNRATVTLSVAPMSTLTIGGINYGAGATIPANSTITAAQFATIAEADQDGFAAATYKNAKAVKLTADPSGFLYIDGIEYVTVMKGHQFGGVIFNKTVSYTSGQPGGVNTDGWKYTDTASGKLQLVLAASNERWLSAPSTALYKKTANGAVTRAYWHLWGFGQNASPYYTVVDLATLQSGYIQSITSQAVNGYFIASMLLSDNTVKTVYIPENIPESLKFPITLGGATADITLDSTTWFSFITNHNSETEGGIAGHTVNASWMAGHTVLFAINSDNKVITIQETISEVTSGFVTNVEKTDSGDNTYKVTVATSKTNVADKVSTYDVRAAGSSLWDYENYSKYYSLFTKGKLTDVSAVNGIVKGSDLVYVKVLKDAGSYYILKYSANDPASRTWVSTKAENVISSAAADNYLNAEAYTITTEPTSALVINGIRYTLCTTAANTIAANTGITAAQYGYLGTNDKAGFTATYKNAADVTLTAAPSSAIIVGTNTYDTIGQVIPANTILTAAQFESLGTTDKAGFTATYTNIADVLLTVEPTSNLIINETLYTIKNTTANIAKLIPEMSIITATQFGYLSTADKTHFAQKIYTKDASGAVDGYITTYTLNVGLNPYYVRTGSTYTRYYSTVETYSDAIATVKYTLVKDAVVTMIELLDRDGNQIVDNLGNYAAQPSVYYVDAQKLVFEIRNTTPAVYEPTKINSTTFDYSEATITSITTAKIPANTTITAAQYGYLSTENQAGFTDDGLGGYNNTAAVMLTTEPTSSLIVNNAKYSLTDVLVKDTYEVFSTKAYVRGETGYVPGSYHVYIDGHTYDAVETTPVVIITPDSSKGDFKITTTTISALGSAKLFATAYQVSASGASATCFAIFGDTVLNEQIPDPGDGKTKIVYLGTNSQTIIEQIQTGNNWIVRSSTSAVSLPEGKVVGSIQHTYETYAKAMAESVNDIVIPGSWYVVDENNEIKQSLGMTYSDAYFNAQPFNIYYNTNNTVDAKKSETDVKVIDGVWKVVLGDGTVSNLRDNPVIGEVYNVKSGSITSVSTTSTTYATMDGKNVNVSAYDFAFLYTDMDGYMLYKAGSSTSTAVKSLAQIVADYQTYINTIYSPYSTDEQIAEAKTKLAEAKANAVNSFLNGDFWCVSMSPALTYFNQEKYSYQNLNAKLTFEYVVVDDVYCVFVNSFNR